MAMIIRFNNVKDNESLKVCPETDIIANKLHFQLTRWRLF